MRGDSAKLVKEDRRSCRVGAGGGGIVNRDRHVAAGQRGAGDDASDLVSPWTLFLFYRGPRCDFLL